MYKTIFLAIFPIFIFCGISQAATWQVDFKGILFQTDNYEDDAGRFYGAFTFDDTYMDEFEGNEGQIWKGYPEMFSLTIYLGDVKNGFSKEHDVQSYAVFMDDELVNWTAYSVKDIQLPIGDRIINAFSFSLLEGGYGSIETIGGDNFTTNWLDPTTFSWQAYPVSAVPLPAALPLYGAGMALLGFFGWRRKKRNEGMALSKA
ncbi:MAG: hypothetical protein ABJN40_14855 [Sneathiella sp.]